MERPRELKFAARIRLLNDPPLAGFANMARDEALLALVGAGTSLPTLRLYEWSEPTVSLGYFQQFADMEATSAGVAQLPVVRRLTGGGAILHDRELTYSLTLPTAMVTGLGGSNCLYELVHDALVSCVRSWGVRAARADFDDGSGAGKGPFFCFARRHRYDVLIGADKVAGSAQRRARDAVLQHGSIVLERRYDEQPAAALGVFGVDVSALRRAFAEAVGGALAERDVVAGEWTADELAAAAALESKYAGDEWTRRR